MLELGQPMHSFDGSKVESIVVRDVGEDTNFTTLDGTDRVLPKGTMVIDLNSEIGAVAGVMGGLSSEIESDTTSTFLESANFDCVKVRKTATALGLRSESSARYEKSLDPEMTETALRRYVKLLSGIDNGAKVVSSLTDVYVNKYPLITIEVEKSYIDRYAGIDISKENAKLNSIDNIRYINDDCQKFVEREIRRGKKYDIVLMDPPSFGRGPKGETWKIEDDIFNFVKLVKGVVSDNALMVLINSYTTGLQPTVMANILNCVFPNGKVDAYEIGLPTSQKGVVLPCGCTAVTRLDG